MHDASKYQLDTEPSILRFTLQYWRKPKEKTQYWLCIDEKWLASQNPSSIKDVLNTGLLPDLQRAGVTPQENRVGRKEKGGQL